ncbi:DUF6152 family protein [Aurantimonas sp. VKM B-3413]|uniref:DUF6152 family protein n=1 Tax=Aurantimonas sp. VKM B-3413 TaxID=2779401 RepID=UPI001E505E66|nr:DUF6152 family protein [Aurantimonas sp. VKM B-3413]MCB8838379.1 hypothetical protein [Aurantimonas sp. VKM B-3413]
MPTRRTHGLLAAAAFALILGPVAALAHHGWAWTEDEESRLAGTIRSIELGNPHAHLEVETSDGVWQVDLAPPYATERAGFVEGAAKVGDEASFTGHRSRDQSERAFKAETITVGGKTYDVYPRREKSLEPEI